MNPLIKSLRDQADQKTADYIDAVLKEQQALSEPTPSPNQQDIETRMTELEKRFDLLTRDDKYLLTKAKLIRLMKDMGYL